VSVGCFASPDLALGSMAQRLMAFRCEYWGYLMVPQGNE
jgi:hypothetical protein